MTKVSIIVCTYNRADRLQQTLESIAGLDLTGSVSAELVLVDNNSKDHTRSIVDAYAEKSAFPVRYFFESNQGLSHARNRALKEASGDFLLFTDDDVRPEKNWVQVVLSAFDGYAADCVGGKIIPDWEHEPARWLTIPEMKDTISGVFAVLDRGDEVFAAETLDRNMFYGANMSFRRKVFDQVGAFRTDLGRSGNNLMSGEDTDLLERIFAAGLKIVYEPRAVVHHFVPKERMNLKYFRSWRFHKARSTVLAGGQKTSRPPVWLVLECLGHGARMIGAYLTLNREKAISMEMQFWTQLGQISGYCQR